MKKRYILTEFLLIFIFLVLPPLFVTNGQGLSKAASFSPAALMQLAIAMVLQVQFQLILREKKNSGTPMLFRAAFWWSITLGCLMLIFAVMQTLTLFFEKEALSRNLLPAIEYPFGWFFLVFSVLVAALYEEVIYRQFIPVFAARLLGSKMSKKWVWMGLEFITVLVFALSHRYLGWIPVLNAMACGSVLRICYRKTGSIWTGAAAHFTYNFTLVLFSILS